MRALGRSLVAGLLCFVGCADATFDLLPKGKEAGPSHDGASGAGNAGTESGGTGGNTPKGGDGGTGNLGQAGDHPNGCGPLNCCDDSDCGGPTPYCFGRVCVECRVVRDCRDLANCEPDCPDNDRCDSFTAKCAPSCHTDRDCPTELRHCDGQNNRLVCVECNPNNPLQYPCDHDRPCNYLGRCVECLNNDQCPTEERPVCDQYRDECKATCDNDMECNNGTNFGPRTCYDGRCVAPPPSPYPDP